MTSPMSLSITQTITGATGALLEGDHAGALALLQSALTNAKLGLSAAGQETPLSQEIRRRMPFQLYALPLELQQSCDNHRSSCPCSIFSFYNSVVISDEMCAEAEPFFATELSAMILYNLGLLYHRLALLTGSTTYFSKAMKLYDIAASIVLSPGAEQENFHHDLTVLQLALYVNMGHIYSNFLEQEGTMRCAEGIQTLFSSVDVNCLNPETRKLFYQNMFVTHAGLHLSLAPAA
uniref:KIF-binding protein n=1 Tax=Amphora coffeiformis TaxID=265554 RepID=A0A7S3L496_9STRA|mmetsp:Transcript_16336/g.31068  ORF Transcript_16336/g.31068 Transcript_16336/m.31068 type:complete len:235 (-) Transcript_16336:207-911(-)|eukprot:scaffold2103_cov185-Amphora_coffeaeformis.AAC.5